MPAGIREDGGGGGGGGGGSPGFRFYSLGPPHIKQNGLSDQKSSPQSLISSELKANLNLTDVNEATFENQPTINELIYSPLQREENQSIMPQGNDQKRKRKKDQSSDAQNAQEDIASDNETLQHGGDGRNEVSTQRYIQ